MASWKFQKNNPRIEKGILQNYWSLSTLSLWSISYNIFETRYIDKLAFKYRNDWDILYDYFPFDRNESWNVCMKFAYSITLQTSRDVRTKSLTLVFLKGVHNARVRLERGDTCSHISEQQLISIIHLNIDHRFKIHQD